MPQKKEFFAGVQTYSVFKRYLENESGKIRSLQHFFLLSYGVYDWLAIDLKGGCGNVKQRPLSSGEVDYASGFAGGYGFRLAFPQWQKINSVFGFQHISAHPETTHLENVKNRAILDDWQVSLLFSRNLGKLMPYLGVKWSRTDYIHTIGDARKRVMSDLTKTLGLVLGFDILATDKSWVNLEGQFFDSEAFAFSLNYSF